MSERTLARVGGLEVEAWVVKETKGYYSCLDFGSGLGAYTRVVQCPVRHGIEAFEPYVKASREDDENRGAFFILGDMRYYPFFITKPYDVALFVDSLEHLTKDDGIELLKMCQRDFEKIAIYVPIGIREQDPCDGNELQRHLSTWVVEDFAKLGFYCENFHNNDPSVAVVVWGLAR